MFENKHRSEKLAFPPQLRHVAPSEYKTELKKDCMRPLTKAEVDWVIGHPTESIGLYKLQEANYYIFPYKHAYRGTPMEYLIIAIVSNDPKPHLISFSNPNAAILLENNTRIFLHDGSLGEFLPF